MKKKHKLNRIFTLNNPLSPRICPELATEIGLNESILLLQYEFWLATEGEVRDDEHLWVRKTIQDVRQVFSFWSTGTVVAIHKKLLESGYLVSGEFDGTAGKSGRWFRFDSDKLKTLKSIHVECSESEQPLFKIPAESFRSRTSVLISNKEEDHTLSRKKFYKGSTALPPKTPPPPYYDEEFLTELAAFTRYRKKLKKPLEEEAAVAFYLDLAGLGSSDRAIFEMRRAMAKGWSGIHPEKTPETRRLKPNGLPDVKMTTLAEIEAMLRPSQE